MERTKGGTMKKILLVDNLYLFFNKLIGETCIEFAQVISCVPALTSKKALEIIRGHPDADYILLGGSFLSGTCADVVPRLTNEEVQKIICFSGDPLQWKERLSGYGVKHFPGKSGDYRACMNGTCDCDS